MPSCVAVLFGIAGAGFSRLRPESMGFALGGRVFRQPCLPNAIRCAPLFKVLVLKGDMRGAWIRC
jgi:hypothetical protein